jgi:MFS family permease
VGALRRRDFRVYWLGQSVSLVGSRVTFLALPLVAVVALGATPVQVGLLAAAGELPGLLFGLAAGVWADRLRRRPLLVVADLGRALLLLTVPLAWGLGVLRVEALYAVAFLAGALRLLFDVAAGAYLPGLVGPARLVDASARLSLSDSAAQLAGPGLAGGLVQLAGAPAALVADAASFAVSAAAVGLIRTPEPPPAPMADRRPFWAELRAGLRLVLASPLLRPLVIAGAWVGFWNNVLEAVSLLYLVRVLGLPPALLGLVFTVAGAGPLLGAIGAPRVAARLGVGPALIAALAVTAAADAAAPLLGWTPLAGTAPVAVAAVLAGAQLCFGAALVLYQVTSRSVRQSCTPDALRGRVGGTTRFLAGALGPAGSVLGGLLGQAVGLQATFFLAVAGELLAVTWLLRSPVRTLRHLPPPPAG